MELDFREAIELMKAGKEDGFNKLYSATYQRVYFRAKQCTKTESDAQDVTQITFIEAYKNIGRLETPEATLSWLYTIVYNQSCKMYRNEREKRELLLSEETEGFFDIAESTDIDTMPELSADQKATAEIIRGIIEELPELQKMTVLAFYFDNLKLEQIAEIMECSVNTVKSRLNYARKYIKDRVESEEKKGGYKLHAFALPTLLWAIRLMSEKTTLTAHAAENIYAESCSALGLKASTLALTGTGAATSATSAGSAASATATTAKTAAAVGGKLGTAKAMMIAGAIAIGGAGTFGGVWMYQHSHPEVIEELQLEDGVGTKDADIDVNTADSISLDNCGLWTTFDDFVPVTSKFCDELRFSFLFPSAAVDMGNGKLRIEAAYPAEYMVLEVEQTAHSSRYTDLIYEKDGKRIYREGNAQDGKYLYFIEPDTSNWMNVKLLVVGDTRDSKFADFSNTFVTAFEKSLIENMENSGNTNQAKVQNNTTGDVGATEFTEMIGEYTATDGTKLWIATPFGEYDYVRGPMTVAFIKENDISWTDTGAEYDGSKTTCYYSDTQKIYITKTGEDTISVVFFNGDKLDYKLTNPGYNCNDF